MYKVVLCADGYNKLCFCFDDMKVVQNFIEMALTSVDETETLGLTAKIEYIAEFAKKKEEKEEE